ncbi:hypothetical protein HAX54_004289 [Datura stramonium]|uniref:Epidermal patterning factor-like protein n=1 Tax=Datura stramonium TaxID=4076 RepID=A0ABS8WVE9_DATST|nr:hypothetical protein [Datura stramonium]
MVGRTHQLRLYSGCFSGREIKIGFNATKLLLTKCNQCHPCMAVQVPSHNVVDSSGGVTRTQAKSMDTVESSLSSAESSRYSNYKPLGWKCRCGGHFYNP